MGIIRRQRKDKTDAWQVLIRPAGGKTIVRTYDDEESAKLFHQATENELKATRLRKALAARVAKAKGAAMVQKVVPRADDPQFTRATYDAEKLSDTLRSYAKSSEVKDKAAVCIRILLRTVGDVRLAELKARWVKQYIDHMRTTMTQFGKPYEYSTIQGLLSAVNCALRWRAEDLDLAPIPLPFNKRTMFPRFWSNQRSRRLDRDEELRLFAALRDVQGASNRHYRLLTRFALETGARLQELVLATWSEFDISQRKWTVPREHDKTGFGRWMILSRRAMRILRVLLAIKDASKPRVFHLLGKPQSVSSVFGRIVERAGLDDFVFHDLRHDATSRMVLRQRAMDIDLIMQFIGHSSIEMHRRYKNLRPEEVAKLVN